MLFKKGRTVAAAIVGDRLPHRQSTASDSDVSEVREELPATFAAGDWSESAACHRWNQNRQDRQGRLGRGPFFFFLGPLGGLVAAHRPREGLWPPGPIGPYSKPWLPAGKQTKIFARLFSDCRTTSMSGGKDFACAATSRPSPLRLSYCRQGTAPWRTYRGRNQPWPSQRGWHWPPWRHCP